MVSDNTTKNIVNDVLIIALDERESNDAEEEVRENQNTDNQNQTTANTEKNNQSEDPYADMTESILSIPCIGISYPVLSETSDELLKISLNKYWGNGPNKIGNYCIVGHNYANGKLFGKLNQMEIGDIATLKDLATGKTVTYEAYNKYIVDPTDVSCTSQLTNGKREMTLITCKNYGTQRLIIKCREV